jgi:hypothetical protein
LKKDRHRRLQHIGDARIEIEEVQSGPETHGQPHPDASPRRERLVWIAGLALVMLIAAVAIVSVFAGKRPFRNACRHHYSSEHKSHIAGHITRWSEDCFRGHFGRPFPIQLHSDGQTLEAGTPIPLFRTRVGGAVQGTNRQQYAVSANGQRFLMNTLATEPSTAPITVLLNWKPKS